MNIFSISKTTGLDVQSSIFLKSLRKQMDSMATSKSNLVKIASSYRDDGCSDSEIKELLIIDGYDIELVENYLSKKASNQHSDGARWGFDIEDSYGKILTHEDLGIEICAADEKQAMAKAQEMIKLAGCDPDYEKIVSIYQLPF